MTAERPAEEIGAEYPEKELEGSPPDEDVFYATVFQTRRRTLSGKHRKKIEKGLSDVRYVGKMLNKARPVKRGQ